MPRNAIETFTLTALGWLWLVWLAGWWLAAIGNKQTRWRESPWSMALHRVPLWIAAFLMAAPASLPAWMRVRLAAPTIAMSIIGVALVAVGLAFTVWARICLGRNWSGSITVKHEHSLVQAGPYRRIRHPIYTGLLVAFVGTLVAELEWRSVIAMVFATAALVVKGRLEEARMRQTFPEYDDYRRRTSALVPFVF